ncbi:putative ribonuclease H-like domain-containing protein [Tanacetum coccineum]
MDLETAQTNTTAKLPLLKQGEYEMWKLRIEQYFQVQDYALWDVIENGNSFKPVARTTTNADGTSTSLIPGPVTADEKTQKKNDVKARSMLLMALPNEHLLTFNQYKDAKTLFAAIQTRFGGNDATKKTQKTLLKQMYENFNAPSTESLDSIFNRLQKIVSQLAILGEIISQEDLNLKFLRSLPSEWNTHVVVWRNKPDLDTMSFDDLYNNFKIVEQEVKGTANSSSSLSSQNMAFMSSPSSTNEVNTAYEVNTANIQVSPASTQVSTASTQVSTANLSDATVYAFLANQPNGSQLVHEDLEQIHEDDLEEMDLKWQLALLSMRTRRFFQKTGRKITINGSDTAGYDKSKVECFNCHKLGHFARECRGSRKQDSRNWNQDSSKRTINVEDTSSKAMLAIDRACYDWNYMADNEEVRYLIKVEKAWGLGFASYNAVPPPHTGLFAPLTLDLSNSGLEEFQKPQFESYGPKISKSVSENVSNEVRKSLDAPLVEELVSDVDKPKAFNTARPNTVVVNAVRANQVNAVKASACWVWRPTKLNSASITFKRHNYIDARGRSKSAMAWVPKGNYFPYFYVQDHPQQEDQSYVDSGCSRYMTRNMSYLSDFKEFDRGYVTFGGGAKGGRITSKGTLKTSKLNFKDVYFVKELQFNLFSVSQMCDKKNSVLFIDTRCFVLSLDFKLTDESHVLLKVPRKNNMYSVDMKNIIPKESLTCLVAKATLDESML